jgi:pimeloyl-ACP methyl ester carboxylesterase
MDAERKLLAGLALSIVAMLGSLPAAAATPVPSGRWSFVFTDAKGRPDRPIRVFTYRAKQCDENCPIVIVLHGAKRDAYPYMKHWGAIADEHKLIVIGPQFEDRHWPKAAAYNEGDVKAQPGSEGWAFAAIEHIFDEVRVGQKDYVLFGHGAGAQLVQRMAIYRPDNRARVMIAANPGWYTMPEWRKDKVKQGDKEVERAIKDPFPHSMIDSPAGEAEIRAGLQKRLVLVVNDKDPEPSDAEGLEKADLVRKQGDSRMDRAENFIKAATAASQELGVKLAWELMEAPDKAVDAWSVSEFAGNTIFGKR